jgi:hypothetical protein
VTGEVPMKYQIVVHHLPSNLEFAGAVTECDSRDDKEYQKTLAMARQVVVGDRSLNLVKPNGHGSFRFSEKVLSESVVEIRIC